MSRSPPQSNSLLNLLNPYSSMARSTHPGPQDEPESPSTMLLRELQGTESNEGDVDDGEEDGDENQEQHARLTASLLRERLSPTPTPSHTQRRPSAIATTHTTSASSDDDDQPPKSLMYAASAITPIPGRSTQPGRAMSVSPGPFKPALSSSASEPRSRSTSPGPSTISNYASGLEATTLEPSAVTSPVRNVPTFREPPRPSPPTRTISGSSSKRKSPRQTGQGYLDPSLSSSATSRKGKGKAKNVGGRKYHQVGNRDDDGDDDRDERDQGEAKRSRPLSKQGLNDYERALWKWVNVDDLDGFLQEVYAFYKGKGFYCIFLAKLLNLLTTFFVIGFSTFLMSCIDYSKLWSTTTGPDAVARLDDVLVSRCLISGSIPHMLFIFTVLAVYAFQLFTFLMSIPRLVEMHRFYTHLLGVPDVDIQTLPWPEIVRLIGDIRKHNPITSLSNGQSGALAEMVGDDSNTGDIKKLDAHDVANRILRQENYLIALFNKDLLDLRFRFPIPQSVAQHVPQRFLAPPAGSDSLPTANSTDGEPKYLSFGANTLTKALEWNLRYCLMGYLFDRRGQVRKEFVKERRRKDLVEGLKHRFIFMGCLNLMFSPFIVFYLLIYSFFRYFEEYHKNPSSIGGRQYTPYAQWKFREFNELPHLFERRTDRSYPVAKEYIDQFPKERTALVMRFVAFVAGSFAAVLLVASLIDPDLFLHFEITPHRTVLFYLGIFGSILAIARGMVPEENLVFDPEASLRELVYWTHYLPGEWKGKLHSQMVHAEFSTLFQLKIQVFFTELLSVLLTPWILFFSLPPCSAAIIDFFREFTLHVDGIGYVCSFAVFDFERHGTVKVDSDDKKPASSGPAGAATGAPAPGIAAINTSQRKRQSDYKMEKSFLHFKATHPDWQPDLNGSLFLDKVSSYQTRPPRIPRETGMGQSYYAGGRGLGLDDRSRRYDQAWAKGSHLLRNRRDPSPRLATMREHDDDEAGDGVDRSGRGLAEEMGWNRRVDVDDRDDDESEEEEGFMRDAGMVGLLQQVMNR